MVALGLYTALKNVLHCSAAELICGHYTLQLPVQLLYSSRSNTIDQVTYVPRLKETMTKLQATLTHYHMKQRPFASSDLFHCTYVLYDKIKYVSF